MKRIAISGIVVLFVAVFFIVGIFTGATALSVAGFCLWSPSVFAFGWAMASSGLRVTVQQTAKPQTIAKKSRFEVAS